MIGARSARPTSMADTDRLGIMVSRPRRPDSRPDSPCAAGRGGASALPAPPCRGRRRRERITIAITITIMVAIAIAERRCNRRGAPLSGRQTLPQPGEADADQEAEEQRDDRIEGRSRRDRGARCTGRPGHEHDRRGRRGLADRLAILPGEVGLGDGERFDLLPRRRGVAGLQGRDLGADGLQLGLGGRLLTGARGDEIILEERDRLVRDRARVVQCVLARACREGDHDQVRVRDRVRAEVATQPRAGEREAVLDLARDALEEARRRQERRVVDRLGGRGLLRVVRIAAVDRSGRLIDAQDRRRLVLLRRRQGEHGNRDQHRGDGDQDEVLPSPQHRPYSVLFHRLSATVYVPGGQANPPTEDRTRSVSALMAGDGVASGKAGVRPLSPSSGARATGRCVSPAGGGEMGAEKLLPRTGGF